MELQIIAERLLFSKRDDRCQKKYEEYRKFTIIIIIIIIIYCILLLLWLIDWLQIDEKTKGF